MKRGVDKVDDLIPPAPPGAIKKKGFFKRIFSKTEKQPRQQIETNNHFQELLKSTPSKLEEMHVDSHNLDLDKIRLQLGLNPGLEQKTLNSPSSTNKANEDLKARYAPLKLEIPTIAKTKVDYKTIDFTHDPQTIAKKETITYIKNPQSDTPAGLDWTKDSNQDKPIIQVKKEFVAEPTSKQLKGLEADLLEDLKPKTATIKDKESPLEVQLKPQVKPDFTSEISVEPKKITPETPQIEESTPEPAIELTPPKKQDKEDHFLSQPVLKFTTDLKDKLREQVREEEREKILKEYSDERQLFEKQRAEFKKEKEEYENKQKEELVEEKEAYEEKIRVEKSLKEERHRLEKLKDEIKKEREQLKADLDRDEHINSDVAKLRTEFKDLQEKLRLANETIELNKKMEENLVKREEALKEAQAKLENMEALIKEKGFSDFLSSELQTKEIEYPKYAGPEDNLKESHSEVYVLADECRNLIWQNKLEDAKDKYTKARELYHEMLNKGDENPELYLMIRELYDDLNLAILK